MLPTLSGARFLQLLLLLLAFQSLSVATADTAAAGRQPPAGDASPYMCGLRRGDARETVEAGLRARGARRARCAPREDLPPELKHQYTSDQVVGIVQDIKHRLGHLQVPSIEKQRKKGRRRPKQPKQKKHSTHRG